MPIINTRRNYVMVGNALPGDRDYAIYIALRVFATYPIEGMADSVRWAVEMADFMKDPIMILPVPSADEWWRKIVVAIGFEGLWRADPDEKRMGRDLLIAMGELKE